MTRPALRGDPTPEQVRLGFLTGLVLGCVAGLVVGVVVAGRAEPGDSSGEHVAKIVVWGASAGLLTLFAPGVWRYSGVGWAVGMVSALALMFAVGSFLGGLGS